MYRLRQKRLHAARILLGIFMIMTMLSALHTHDAVVKLADDCEACVNHLPHSGHLSATSFAMHDCVLCQFLGLACTAVAGMAVAFFAKPRLTGQPARAARCLRRVVGTRQGRAPPCCF